MKMSQVILSFGILALFIQASPSHAEDQDILFRRYFDVNHPSVLSRESVVSQSRNTTIEIADVLANVGFNFELETIVGPDFISLFCHRSNETGALTLGQIYFDKKIYEMRNPEDCAVLENSFQAGNSVRVYLKKGKVKSVKAK